LTFLPSPKVGRPREAPDIVAGRVRINQCVAAALVLGAGGALLARTFAS